MSEARIMSKSVMAIKKSVKNHLSLRSIVKRILSNIWLWYAPLSKLFLCAVMLVTRPQYAAWLPPSTYNEKKTLFNMKFTYVVFK